MIDKAQEQLFAPGKSSRAKYAELVVGRSGFGALLKYELVVPITSSERPTAVASANWHQDHFGDLFAIRDDQGQTAHTACVGFGLERVTLALLRVHGTAPERWPRAVRSALQL